MDDFNDNGIDAVFYEASSNILWIIQAKWIKSGTGCPGAGDVSKLITGVKDLINCRFERFNEKVRAKKDEIISALDDLNIRINIVLSYTGSPLSEQPRRVMEDFVTELNSTLEAGKYIEFPLAKVHQAISTLSQGENINFDLTLFNWGFNDDPFLSFYGFAGAYEIAGLWEKFDQKLFHKNIRKFLGITSVNNSISETISKQPESFFSFNNGMTIMAQDDQEKGIQ